MPTKVETYTSGKRKEVKVATAPSRRAQARHWAASKPGIRQLGAIEQADAYSRPQFRPEPIGPSAESKREYAADVAAHGVAFAQKKQQLKEAARSGKLIQRKAAAEAAQAPRVAKPQFSQEDVNFLKEEIADRTRFLNQLEKLGRGKSDDARAIKAELATKGRMLDVVKKNMN